VGSPDHDIERQAQGDDVDITPFRTAIEWARLRATDIDAYRLELSQQLLGGDPLA
jgi:hypothetical protein